MIKPKPKVKTKLTKEQKKLKEEDVKLQIKKAEKVKNEMKKDFKNIKIHDKLQIDDYMTTDDEKYSEEYKDPVDYTVDDYFKEKEKMKKLDLKSDAEKEQYETVEFIL